MTTQESLNEAIKHLQEAIESKLSSGSEYPSGDSERSLISIQDSAVVMEATIGSSFHYETSITYGGDRAPYAVAFELGSGEHAGRGTYKIEPKDADALSFYWPEIGSQVIVPKGGGFQSHYEGPNLFVIGKGRVDHPGIKAKPYIDPTVKEQAPALLGIIGEGFVADMTVMVNEMVKEEIRIDLEF